MEEVAYLFSIYPEYAYRILSGEKKFEYRKRVAKLYLKRLIIYATAPISKIIGEVCVDEILRDTPQTIWRRTNKYGGIQREQFFAYFDNKSLAYAYSLSDPILYGGKLSLNDIGITNPPQSFIYLNRLQVDVINRIT